MGADHPLRADLRIVGSDAEGGGPRSPLAVKRARPKAEGEPSLCAIKIAREAPRGSNERLEPRQDAEAAVAMGFRGDEMGATVLNISSRGAMIRCEIEPFIGEPLELTFPGDERIGAVVRWIKDGCVGVEFGAAAGSGSGPAEAGPCEPPPLRQLKLVDPETDRAAEAGAASHRSAKRARVLLACRLQTRLGPVDARLRDLSCKGALLECKRTFEVGDAVVFSRGATIAPARVAWTSGDRIGLEFDKPIEEAEVLVHVNRSPPPPQNHIQAMERARGANTEFRRPSFSDRLSDYDRKLARVVGASLGVSLIDE